MQSQKTIDTRREEFVVGKNKGAVIFAGLGRVFLALALVALVGAWTTQVTKEPLLGMSQLHLFLDAVVLGVLGIAFLIDAVLHDRGY